MIRMGQEPEVLRLTMERTERRSWRLIGELDFPAVLAEAQKAKAEAEEKGAPF